MSVILEEKIQKLFDVEEIRTLMAKYCHGIDKRNEELFLSVWAEDGDFKTPRGQAIGTEGIRTLLRTIWEQVPKCHHHITNPVIDIDGDRAGANTDVIFYRETSDGTINLLSGMYKFGFVRRAGEWRIISLRSSSHGVESPLFEIGPASRKVSADTADS